MTSQKKEILSVHNQSDESSSKANIEASPSLSHFTSPPKINQKASINSFKTHEKLSDLDDESVNDISNTNSTSSQSAFAFGIDDKNVNICCEINFMHGIRTSFENITEIDTADCLLNESVMNDFSGNLNQFWNNIAVYNCFNVSIEDATERYDEYMQQRGGGGHNSSGGKGVSGNNNRDGNGHHYNNGINSHGNGNGNHDGN